VIQRRDSGSNERWDEEISAYKNAGKFFGTPWSALRQPSLKITVEISTVD
jgi:hypothetical protein